MAIRATSDFYFWRCAREERNVGVFAALRPYDVGSSSLGRMNEFKRPGYDDRAA